MTRSNARELAVHLIYSRFFTGEEPEAALDARLEREYYAALSSEHEVYAERPSRKPAGVSGSGCDGYGKPGGRAG